MGPKTTRTPMKKEPQEEEDLDNLVFLLEEQKDVLDRLKVKLDATLVEERTADAAQVHQRKLNACSADFAAVKERIYRADPKKRNDHKKKAMEFEALFDQLAMTLGGWKAGATPAASFVPAASSALAERNTPQPIVIQQPLPRIIPSFDGKYENWEKFKVMFLDVVDKSNESERIKLYHLDDALVGEASGILDAKTIQDGNYAHAWELLNETYEDKRRMVDLHVGALLNLKKLDHADHKELKALVDSVVGNVENLKYLGQQFTGVSEHFVVYLLGHALDDVTKEIWESTVAKGVLPKYDEMIKTLKDRISVLERCKDSSDTSTKQQPRVSSKPITTYQIANTAVTSKPVLQCDFCNGHHLTFKCGSFNALTVCQRLQKVKEKRVCFNCLRAGHGAKNCRRTSSCGKCQRRHHTLLHDFYRKSTAPQTPDSAVGKPDQPRPPAEVIDSPTPMLQTAVVELRDDKNRPVPCRILLDSGSQVNFISTSMANRLHLSRISANVPICGIGGEVSSTKESITVQLHSRFSSFTTDVECLVISKVSGKIPSSPVNATDWPIPKDIQLADPKFYSPDRIDMLVGASLYFRLLKRGFVQMWDNYPELRETHLGWVVVGGTGGSINGHQFAHTALPIATSSQEPALDSTTVDSNLNGLASAGCSPSPGGGCWSTNLSKKNGNTCHRRTVCYDQYHPVFGAQRQPLQRSTTGRGG